MLWKCPSLKRGPLWQRTHSALPMNSFSPAFSSPVKSSAGAGGVPAASALAKRSKRVSGKVSERSNEPISLPILANTSFTAWRCSSVIAAQATFSALVPSGPAFSGNPSSFGNGPKIRS